MQNRPDKGRKQRIFCSTSSEKSQGNIFSHSNSEKRVYASTEVIKEEPSERRKANIQTSVDAAEIPEYVFESLARSLLPVRQAGHSQGWARSLDPEKGNAAALVHIPLFTRSPVAVEQQLALLVQQIAKVVLVDGVINPRALHHVGHQSSIKQLVHVMVDRVPG